MHAPLPDGSTIVLRPPTEADISTIYEAALASREELSPWMPWCDEGFNREVAVTWVNSTNENDAERAFTVWDETEGIYLGNCGLHEISSKLRSAEMGYWIRTDQTGRGIATAAARAVANFAFAGLNLVRVSMVIALNNDPSRRVAEKLNAKCEGTQRNGLIHHDEVRDSWLYSLIPSDLNEG